LDYFTRSYGDDDDDDDAISGGVVRGAVHPAMIECSVEARAKYKGGLCCCSFGVVDDCLEVSDGFPFLYF
jgi:hypothetical protein